MYLVMAGSDSVKGIPVKDVGIALLLIALIVLVIYLILFVRNLNKAAKRSNEMLDDLQTITSVAEKRTLEVDNAISNVTETVNSVSKAIKGQETLFKQLSNIATAAVTIVSIVRGKFTKNEQKDCEGDSESKETKDSKATDKNVGADKDDKKKDNNNKKESK